MVRPGTPQGGTDSIRRVSPTATPAASVRSPTACALTGARPCGPSSCCEVLARDRCARRCRARRSWRHWARCGASLRSRADRFRRPTRKRRATDGRHDIEGHQAFGRRSAAAGYHRRAL